MNRRRRVLTTAERDWTFPATAVLLLNAWAGFLAYAAIRGWLMP
jgi:hypothetical protein